MKATVLLLFSLLLVQLSAAESKEAAARRGPRDAIFFRNGDFLYGSLASVDPTNGVTWSRADAATNIQFIPRQITEIVLSGSSSSTSRGSSNYCSVQLKNGDQLQGELLSYDGQELTLGTSYAGPLKLKKDVVALLLPIGLPKPTLFEGPTGLEGWTMGKVNAAALVESGEWTYQNGALYAVKSASIARDVKLPDSASLSFDMEWRGFFHVAVALYTEYLHPVSLASKETEPKFGGFYSLQINPFSANLLPVKQTEPLRYLGQSPLANLAQKTSARIDIRASKSKRIIALLIDGVVVKQWADSDEFAGTGTAVRFVHQGQGAVKIANIKVTEWDGQFEEPPSLTPTKSADLTRLKNGDRISGTVRSIQDGRMKVEGAGQVLELPITRVKQTEFYSEAKSLPAPRGQVRAYFMGGGSVTFELDKWSPEGVVARSANFGAAEFKPGTFSRLVFDLEGAGGDLR